MMRRPRLAALASLVICCQTAAAAVVTLDVTDKSGAAAVDAIVVFDPESAVPPGVPKTVIIDQVNKRFKPHVSVIRTGTSVWFPNSDSIRHQVYSFSNPKPFNIKLYAGSPRTEVSFDKPGLVVLGCNIHDTMVAFVAVVDSPYFSAVPASGRVELNLPPGKYRLRVWHAKMVKAPAPATLTVGADPVAMPVHIDLDMSQSSAAAWPE